MSDIFDSSGRKLAIGPELGRGGEGAVFDLLGNPSRVAKLYDNPLSRSQVDKLRLMAQRVSVDLERFAAWPLDVITDRSGVAIRGFVMRKLTHYEPIHHLYHPAHRRQRFPKADWGFLLRAARNLAIAFDTLHNNNVVVGDVNQNNILVSDNATVALIDCDSFQVRTANGVFRCEVGVSHFTPPELQACHFRDVDRSPNHDLFGLAVVIFHLLFMGRHPFVGIYSGAGDMPIEKAITEGRFAFGRHAGRFQMTPPPNCLPMAGVGGRVSDLFEMSFSQLGPNGSRPIAQEWHKSLEALETSLCVCKIDSLHRYLRTLTSCPWCDIEIRGGYPFFVSSARITTFDPCQDFDIAWKKIEAIFQCPLSPTLSLAPASPGLQPTPVPIEARYRLLLPYRSYPTLPVFIPEPTPSAPRFEPQQAPEDPIFSPAPPPTLPPSVQQVLHQGYEAILFSARRKVLAQITFEHQIVRGLSVATLIATLPCTLIHPLVGLFSIMLAIVLFVRWMECRSLHTNNCSERVKQAESAAQLDWQRSVNIASDVAVQQTFVEKLNQDKYCEWQRECTRLRAQRVAVSDRNFAKYQEWQTQNEAYLGELAAVEARNAAKYGNWRVEYDAVMEKRKAIGAHNAAIDSAKRICQTIRGQRQQALESLKRRLTTLEQEWASKRAATNRNISECRRQLDELKDSYTRVLNDYQRDRHGVGQNEIAGQMRTYLEKFMIDDADIPNIGEFRKMILMNWNIETAADVEESVIRQIPGFGTGLCANLLGWRKFLERNFRFVPSRAPDPTAMHHLNCRYRPAFCGIISRIDDVRKELERLCQEARGRKSELEREAADMVTRIAQARLDCSSAEVASSP